HSDRTNDVPAVPCLRVFRIGSGVAPDVVDGCLEILFWQRVVHDHIAVATDVVTPLGWTPWVMLCAQRVGAIVPHHRVRRSTLRADIARARHFGILYGRNASTLAQVATSGTSLAIRRCSAWPPSV